MPLLTRDDPAACTVINAAGRPDLVLVCDHASYRVPRMLDNLGLTTAQLQDHIGWDAGAAELARCLSELLDAPLVLANYSRLLIDCNRAPDHPGSIMQTSDGVHIPGNLALTPEQRRERRIDLFEPYHQAIAALIKAREPGKPTIVAIHSFTPVLQGILRPWSIGICSGNDRRLSDPLLESLRKTLGTDVGDNQPYSIEQGVDYTLPYHAGKQDLPHVMLEMSRDQLCTDRHTQQWAQRLAQVLLPGLMQTLSH
ncbi:MAG: N-formylglutamate amidohydrolase [Pseudomonadales bacterium]|nr:N-formylglutamate amidohydrolase [Pseudomonadales bacterium]